MDIRTAALAVCLSLSATSSAEDAKLKDKVFLSQNNLIVGLHLAPLGNSRYVVFRFQNKLDTRLSKGRGVFDRSNFGDSSSTYAYKKEADMSPLEKDMVSAWLENGRTVNFSYTCAELREDDRHLVFPGFAETNCQVLDLTFNKPDPRSPWVR